MLEMPLDPEQHRAFELNDAVNAAIVRTSADDPVSVELKIYNGGVGALLALPPETAGNGWVYLWSEGKTRSEQELKANDELATRALAEAPNTDESLPVDQENKVGTESIVMILEPADGRVASEITDPAGLYSLKMLRAWGGELDEPLQAGYVFVDDEGIVETDPDFIENLMQQATTLKAEEAQYNDAWFRDDNGRQIFSTAPPTEVWEAMSRLRSEARGLQNYALSGVIPAPQGIEGGQSIEAEQVIGMLNNLSPGNMPTGEMAPLVESVLSDQLLNYIG